MRCSVRCSAYCIWVFAVHGITPPTTCVAVFVAVCVGELVAVCVAACVAVCVAACIAACAAVC